MTYQNERKTIEKFFTTQWAAATPVGLDGQEFTPTINSVRLTIASGAVLQGSVGRTANRKDHMGNLTVQIFTDGKKGSAGPRGYVETVISMLMEKTLDNNGAVITSTSDAFLRFSPPTQTGILHPYVSASFKDAPFHVTNVIAPFKRYSTS